MEDGIDMEKAEQKERERQEVKIMQEELMLEEAKEEENPSLTHEQIKKLEEDSEFKHNTETTKGLIEQFCKDETPVFVNGLGIGRVKEVKGEYIIFEITKEEEKSKKKKNKKTGKMDNYPEKTMFKEVTYIPIAKIDTISEGEKEVPKTEDEAKIDEELGDL